MNSNFYIELKEKLTEALRVMINNPFKESFNGKRKKVINVLIAFSIFHKSGVKTSIK